MAKIVKKSPAPLYLAAAVWAGYSVLMRRIGAWGLDHVLCTRRIFSYGLLFMLPALGLLPFRLSPALLAGPGVLPIREKPAWRYSSARALERLTDSVGVFKSASRGKPLQPWRSQWMPAWCIKS